MLVTRSPHPPTHTGTFLRGVLDKVGVEPQVQRIGAYKSAGDQLLRRDMSDAQREQLGELLDDIYDNFLTVVAEARGKTREVRASCVGQSGAACVAIKRSSSRVDS
jgi:hypothetical protein